MPKTIVHQVLFKNTTAGKVYNLYMDPKKHSEISGAPARISGKEGARYSFHSGYITGRNLHLVKNKLIVQSWRGSDWTSRDADSTFIIHLEQKGKNVSLVATHANVPSKHAGHLSKGWYSHYWNPWKRVLAGKPARKSAGM